jgi:hypothetical protein
VRLVNGYLGSYPVGCGTVQYFLASSNRHRPFFLYRLLLGTLCVWRVTHLFQAEDGPWDVVVRIRRAAGEGFPGQLLDCFYCLSLWLAVPFAFLVGEGWKEWFLLWLALSAGSILLERCSAFGPSVLCGGPARWLVAERCGSSFRTGCGGNKPMGPPTESVSPASRLSRKPCIFQYLGLTAVGPSPAGATASWPRRTRRRDSGTRRRCAPSQPEDFSPDRSSLDPGRRYVAEGAHSPSIRDLAASRICHDTEIACRQVIVRRHLSVDENFGSALMP